MGEKFLTEAVLAYPMTEDYSKVLLAIHANKIGAGLWNGYGGLMHDGESPEDAACREIGEESDAIVLTNFLEEAGTAIFSNEREDGTRFVFKVHLFLLRRYISKFVETAEMLKPTWFDVSQLPLNDMMPSDRDWLPALLQGRNIKQITVWYGPGQKTLVKPTKIEYVSVSSHQQPADPFDR